MKGPIRVFRSYRRRFQLKLTQGVELLRPLVDQGLGWLRRIVSGGVPDGWRPSLDQKPFKGPLNQPKESENRVTESVSTQTNPSTSGTGDSMGNTEPKRSMFEILASTCNLVRPDLKTGEIVLLLGDDEVYRSDLSIRANLLGPYATKNEEGAAQGAILADLCYQAMSNLRAAYYDKLSSAPFDKKDGGVHIHFQDHCLINVHGPVASVREIAAQGFIQVRKFIEKLAEVGKVAEMLSNMDTDSMDDEESRCPLKNEFVEGARLIVAFNGERLIDVQDSMADQVEGVKKLGLPVTTVSGAALSWGMDQLKAAVEGEHFSKAPIGNELNVEKSDGKVATAELKLSEAEGSIHLHFGNTCIVRTQGPCVSKHDCVEHAYTTVVEFARETVRALRQEIIESVNKIAEDPTEDSEEVEGDDAVHITVHRGTPGKDFEGNKVFDLLHKHFLDSGQNVNEAGWAGWGFFHNQKLVAFDSTKVKGASGIDWNRGLIPVLGWAHSSLFRRTQTEETEVPLDIHAEFVVSFEGRMVTYGRGTHKCTLDMYQTALQSLEELLVAVRKMPQTFFENQKPKEPTETEGACA